jgi:hypothetical protein
VLRRNTAPLGYAPPHAGLRVAKPHSSLITLCLYKVACACRLVRGWPHKDSLILKPLSTMRFLVIFR